MTRSEAGKLGAIASKIPCKRWRKARRASIYKAWKEQKKCCPVCSGLIKFDRRKNTYCSQSCAARDCNARRVRISIGHVCESCGETWHRESGSRSRVCKKCRKPCVRNKPVEQCGNNRARRRALIRERGHRCETCRRTTWRGQPITIELEHVNGNSEDNEKGNLQLICPNCHSQTPTYKGRNRGNGRYLRRQRYREGKSW